MSINFEDIEAFCFSKNDVLDKNAGLLCSTTSMRCLQVSRNFVSVGDMSNVIFGGTNLSPRYPAGLMIATGTVEKQLIKKAGCTEWILGRTLKNNEYYLFPAEDIILEK